MLVDEHILIRDANGHYNFRPDVAHLLHLVSGVEKSLITKARIYPRSPLRYIPWYRSTKGGGAITLGSKNWQSITFTDNFFSADQKKYSGRAYGDQIDTWLRLAAHEVGHLAHAQKFGSLFIYLWVFIYQYLLHGHDKAPLEIEADQGSSSYSHFNNFINRTYGREKLIQLITDKTAEEKKIDKLNNWWSEFKIQSEASTT